VRHLKRGNKGIGAPSLLEPGLDRISSPARASTVYHGPGFETPFRREVQTLTANPRGSW
jgi:hypothetical protein